MSDDKVEDLTLVQLRGLRREVSAVLEQQARLFEHVTRLYKHVDRFGDEVRRDIGELRNDIRTLQSDVVLLGNHNMSRHGETLNALRRIEPIEARETDASDREDETPRDPQFSPLK